MSNGVRIIPPRPKHEFLRVIGFVIGGDALVSFEGKLLIEDKDEVFDLTPGKKLLISVDQSAGMGKSQTEE